MYARPMPPVYYGDVSAAVILPVFRVLKFPVRVRDISISVDTDFPVSASDYFIIDIVRVDINNTIEWSSNRFYLNSDGLKAYDWKLLLADTGMRANVFYGLRLTVGAGSPTLSGLASCCTVEGRFDDE